MPELTGEPRKTTAEILAAWPSPTMIIDASYGGHIFAVLREWRDGLPTEPPVPTDEELADLEMDEDGWYEYQHNERRPPLHLVTDEWMPTEIAERFGVGDGGLGMDYWPAEYLYPSEKLEDLERALRDLGFTVIRGNLDSDGAFLDRWLP
ncbi:hypothetical protein [Microbispora sp. NBC_01389]|uniref:hypothetical protein n=1 Tax=Microbispora sp. NBC_01389 TaxID=2903584 RepID=UPI0032508CB4